MVTMPGLIMFIYLVIVVFKASLAGDGILLILSVAGVFAYAHMLELKESIRKDFMAITCTVIALITPFFI